MNPRFDPPSPAETPLEGAGEASSAQDESGAGPSPEPAPTGIPESATNDAPAEPPPGELAPNSAGPAPEPPPARGRVLLLEDDASFREIVRDFLMESGYTVVPVQNGGEGVREVLEGQFSVILCDLNMPSLAGDMFYRAVGRIRPEQCHRFIFMTGYGRDEKTTAFLSSIHGTVLRKPFHFGDLLDTITFVEARAGLLEEVEAASEAEAERALAAMLQADAKSRIAALPTDVPIPPSAPRSTRGPIPAVPISLTPLPFPAARTTPYPFPASHASTARFPAEEEERPRQMPLYLAAMLFALLAVGSVHFVKHREADRTMKELFAQQATLQGEWAEAESRQRLAENARAGLDRLPKRAARISSERSTTGWTGLLEAVSNAAGSQIEVRWATARQLFGVSGGCELELTGVAAGTDARRVADEFRRSLLRVLSPRFPEIRVELSSLEDVPGDTPRARFSLSLSTGAAVPKK